MTIIKKSQIQYFLKFRNPIKDIIFFLFLFLAFEFFWKLCIHSGADREQFIVLGTNLTHLVNPICKLDAMIVYRVIHDILGYNNFHIDDTLVFFENSLKMNIIWSCTSIKQLLFFTFIMTFYFGPWKKKLVFVPVSLVFLSFINIVRLVLTSFLLKNGFPEWFIPINEILNGAIWYDAQTSYWKFYEDWYHFFHDGFFKWIYYDGIMFLIWLLWQEKFNLPYQLSKKL